MNNFLRKGNPDDTNPRLESGQELEGITPPVMSQNHMASIQTWVCWLQTQSRSHPVQLPHLTAASSPPASHPSWPITAKFHM